MIQISTYCLGWMFILFGAGVLLVTGAYFFKSIWIMLGLHKNYNGDD